jgi:hypothetical protein
MSQESNRALTTAIVLFISLTSLPAQTPGAIEQVDSFKRRGRPDELFKKGVQKDGTVQEFFKGELLDVGTQSVVLMKPRRRYFETSADSQFFYTSNMFLQEEGNGTRLTDTSVWVNTAQVAFMPPPFQLGPGDLWMRAGYRHQWFNYGLENHARQLGSFDFDAQTVFAEARYRLNDRWVLQAGFDWVRLLNHTPNYLNYDEFYKEYVPSWSVYRQFHFSETKVLIAGYQGNFHFSETPGNPPVNQNNRTDHSLLVSYSHALTPTWSIHPFYRLQFTPYTAPANGARLDVLHSIGLSCQYNFTDRIAARLFVNYDLKESDNPLVADYRKFDAGTGVNFYFRF